MCVVVVNVVGAMLVQMCMVCSCTCGGGRSMVGVGDVVRGGGGWRGGEGGVVEGVGLIGRRGVSGWFLGGRRGGGGEGRGTYGGWVEGREGEGGEHG